MKDDTISRQAAIDALEEPCKVSDTWTDEYAVGERMQWEKDVKALNSLPSVQPERKEGKWLNHIEKGMCECMECGEIIETERAIRANYCPNCGADMRGEVNG